MSKKPYKKFHYCHNSNIQKFDNIQYLMKLLQNFSFGLQINFLWGTMDLDFDRQAGLHSLPARLGLAGARRLAALCHAAMLVAWVQLLRSGDFGWPMTAAFALAALLVTLEHILADPTDMKRMNLVFFRINVVISCAMFAGAAGEVWGPGLW